MTDLQIRYCIQIQTMTCPCHILIISLGSDHCRIVCTINRRRIVKSQSRLIACLFHRSAECRIGSYTTGHGNSFLPKLFGGSHGPSHQHINYRLLDGIAGDAGNIATIVALLGSLNVYGIIAAAMFFSVLLCGGASMQRMTEVPYSVVNVIQGLIIILVTAKNTVMASLERRLKKLRAAGKKEERTHVE